MARLYEQWWQDIRSYTWDELRKFRYYIKAPADEVMLNMILNEPGNAYFDMQDTEKKEDAADIITQAFVAAFKDVKQLQKEGKVKWSDYHKVNLMHLTNLAAFSRMNIPAAGQQGAPNAISLNWGPSWRMIVELGNRPRAFGIYPGGQSGNPAGRYYDNFIDDWNNGKYYPLLFFMAIGEAQKQAVSSWTLDNK
jgi:penicillin amidase